MLRDRIIAGLELTLEISKSHNVPMSENVKNILKIRDLPVTEKLTVKPSRNLHYHVLARIRETGEFIVAIEEGYTSAHTFNWHISNIVRTRRIIEEREEYERVTNVQGRRAFRIVLKRVDVTANFEDVPHTSLDGEVVISEIISLTGHQERVEVRPLEYSSSRRAEESEEKVEKREDKLKIPEKIVLIRRGAVLEIVEPEWFVDELERRGIGRTVNMRELPYEIVRSLPPWWKMTTVELCGELLIRFLREVYHVI